MKAKRKSRKGHLSDNPDKLFKYADRHCQDCNGLGYLIDYVVVPYGSATATEELIGDECGCVDWQRAQRDGWTID